MVHVICEACGISFNRNIGEVNRSKRLGRRQYCSRKCQSTKAIDNIPKSKRIHPENIADHSGMVDEYSPFRRIWLSARLHSKPNSKRGAHEFTLTLECLKKQWESQGGICPITGWKLIIQKSSSDYPPTTPNRASLDRIDSNVGYVPGNVRFIALIAQYAKNGWDDQDLYEFCEAVCENRK